jgi:hypothetical protein
VLVRNNADVNCCDQVCRPLCVITAHLVLTPPTAHCFQFQYPALSAAAKNGHLDVVKYLVAKGAIVGAKNSVGLINAYAAHYPKPDSNLFMISGVKQRCSAQPPKGKPRSRRTLWTREQTSMGLKPTLVTC